VTTPASTRTVANSLAASQISRRYRTVGMSKPSLSVLQENARGVQALGTSNLRQYRLSAFFAAIVQEQPPCVCAEQDEIMVRRARN
jgi:hypothetical protein